MGAAHVRARTPDRPRRVHALGAQAFEGVTHGVGLEAEGLANDDKAERRAGPPARYPVLRLSSYFLYRAQVTAYAVLENREQQTLDAAQSAGARLAATQYSE